MNTINTNPDRCELLWFLRGEFDEALLKELADYDYDDGWVMGWNMDILGEIFRLGAVPSPMEADAVNVCLLLCGECSTDITKPLPPDKRREQCKRLFACWILLSAYTRPEAYKPGCFDDEDDRPLWALTESSIALGPACIQAAGHFVAWSQVEGTAVHSAHEDYFYWLSLLILRCAAPDRFDFADTLPVYHTLMAAGEKIRHLAADDPYTAALPASDPPYFSGVFGFCPDLFRGEPDKRWEQLAAWSLDRLLAFHSDSVDPQFIEFRQRMLKWKR